APQPGPSPLPFPRSGHTLTATATATATPLGELFLFGGYAHGCASSDLYVFSTRDSSTTLLQTSGEVPIPRAAHGAALIGTTFLICGGKTDFGYQYVLNHDSLYLLNLGTSHLLMSILREWTRVVVNGPGPGGRYYHTTTVVGSKFFVFGGQIDRNFLNDIWALDLNSLKSQPFWESYEPTPGNDKPLPRARHVSVTTEDRIIIFGGYGDQHHYNDTWSFDISTRKWTELQCTGSIPSPRESHAAVLVDDVMYVFGGFSMDEGYLDDLYALQLSTQRWFKFHNVGPSPHGRSAHAMSSDGTRVFVLGGYSKGARVDEISLIHVFDTSIGHQVPGSRA
ncbi:galactose oxidase, partial [Russula emetica]